MEQRKTQREQEAALQSQYTALQHQLQQLHSSGLTQEQLQQQRASLEEQLAGVARRQEQQLAEQVRLDQMRQGLASAQEQLHLQQDQLNADQRYHRDQLGSAVFQSSERAAGKKRRVVLRVAGSSWFLWNFGGCAMFAVVVCKLARPIGHRQ